MISLYLISLILGMVHSIFNPSACMVLRQTNVRLETLQEASVKNILHDIGIFQQITGRVRWWRVLNMICYLLLTVGEPFHEHLINWLMKIELIFKCSKNVRTHIKLKCNKEMLKWNRRRQRQTDLIFEENSLARHSEIKILNDLKH